MFVLIFMEGPLANAAVTTFLGAAVFDDKTSVRQAIRNVLERWKHLLWSQGMLRGILPAMALIALNRFYDGELVVLESVLLVALMIYAGVVRGFRPFLNEIILLERNPWRTRGTQAISAGKRSKSLHDPSNGDLFLRWIGASLVAVLMAVAFIQCLNAFTGLLFAQWRWNWFMLYFGFPSMLWLVTGYMAVVRFLNYLDLRIRHEGWEVELRLRAESVRLSSKLT
jgi:hypothetical protein